MATKPIPVRFEPELLSVLEEGARRTPHKKQELIRITLRKHLASVIDEETSAEAKRVTNVEPWTRKELTRAYRRVGGDWDKLEDRATSAQGKPDYED